MVPSANRQSATASTASDVQTAASVPVSSIPSPETQAPKQLKARLPVPPPKSGMTLVDNRAGNNKGSTPAAKPSPSEPEPSPETLMALNDAAPIEKAKPAPQIAGTTETEPNAQPQTEITVAPGTAALQGRSATSAVRFSTIAAPSSAQHNVTWTITAGVLQRSLDSGQNWEAALHADRPLLCYASHDGDVWTGGKMGTLFHSTDNGVTWVQVHPSIKAQELTFDITRIDLHSGLPSNDLRSADISSNNLRGTDLQGDQPSDLHVPAEIVVSTANSEVWSSADGGKTWQKK
jgi:hypothetical protein